jgi:hypothetical protein
VPRDEVVFFVDRRLGARVVPDALREADANVEVHGPHFPPDASDTDILRLVGARGWALLSKDENVRRRPAERQALVEADVAAFILTVGRARGGYATSSRPSAAYPLAPPSARWNAADGVVWLSASETGEAAQGSDELRGALCTHYWVNGLRGAADGDGRVTLAESYDFA